MATLAPAAPQPRSPQRFTLGQYHRMVALGILGPEDRCELIRGIIEAKIGQNSQHASASARLERRIYRLLGDDWLLRTQKPLTLPVQVSEPEPDFAVVAGPESLYDGRHPTPAAAAVVMEVSDSSLDYDRGEKLLLYAEAGVAEYWVVNLVDRRVEVYTGPSAAGYASRRDYGPGESVPVAVGGATLGTVAVGEVIP